MKIKQSYGPITVGRFTDAIAAHIAKGRLESEGIRVFIANEHHIGANWLFSNALGGVEVQVFAEDEEMAREILQQVNEGCFADAGPEEEALLCPQCGSDEIKEKKASRKVAFLSLFIFQIPLPFWRNNYYCLKCGQRWKESL